MSTLTFNSVSPQAHLDTVQSLLQSTVSSASIRSLFGKNHPTALRVLHGHKTFDLLLGADGQLGHQPQPTGTGYLLLNHDDDGVAAVYLDHAGGFRSLEFSPVFAQLNEHAKHIAALSSGTAATYEVALLTVPDVPLVAVLLLADAGEALVWPLTAADVLPHKLYPMSEFRKALQAPLQRRLHAASTQP